MAGMAGEALAPFLAASVAGLARLPDKQCAAEKIGQDGYIIKAGHVRLGAMHIGSGHAGTLMGLSPSV